MMSLTELLNSVQIVTNQNGEKKAALLDWAVWEEILTLLENLEDAEEIAQLRASDEEVIPWEQAKAELRAEGINV